MTSPLHLPAERIVHSILLIRKKKVMLDSELAKLYGVPTSRLNEQVKRNIHRFPIDFMFRLTDEEYDRLISQNAISKKRGGRRKLPYVFTEQGVAMLSSVLRSHRAVQVNIAIMRTFVQLREMLSTHADLAQKIEELESKYDAQFRTVFDAIQSLMKSPDLSPKRRIGFHANPTE